MALWGGDSPWGAGPSWGPDHVQPGKTSQRVLLTPTVKGTDENVDPLQGLMSDSRSYRERKRKPKITTKPRRMFQMFGDLANPTRHASAY